MPVSEILALGAMWGAGLCGLAMFVLPWRALRIGRWAAAATAGRLQAATLVLFLASAVLMPEKHNIRIDLLINVFLLLAGWLVCGALAAWSLLTGSPDMTRARAAWAGVGAFAFPVLVILWLSSALVLG